MTITAPNPFTYLREGHGVRVSSVITLAVIAPGTSSTRPTRETVVMARTKDPFKFSLVAPFLLHRTMNKLLHGTIISGLLHLIPAAYRSSLIFACPLSTFQKMPEPGDLFEYTSGRWMYVAG